MNKTLPSPWISRLDSSLFGRIRRNHGLEHATLHVLAAWQPALFMAGYSDWRGFWILGDLPTPVVEKAVFEALYRLRSGAHHLAVHPTCGTNLATSGLLAGLGAFLALAGAGASRRSRLERLPEAILLATLGLMISRPLGLWLQREVTTSGDPGELQVLEIQVHSFGGLPLHRILTSG